MNKQNWKGVAFPCIATGIYGFDNRKAAEIALRCAREFVQENRVAEVVFVLFLEKDVKIYHDLVGSYFPDQEGYPDR